MKSLTRGARMLILVSQLIEDCFGLIKQKLESIIVLLVLGFPILGFAQESEFGFSAPPLPSRVVSSNSNEGDGTGTGFHQKLSKKHVSAPGLVSSLSIGKAEEDADSEVLLEAIGTPEPPRDLLMPAGPNAKSFGAPLVNDLRAEAVSRRPDPSVVPAQAEMAIEESPLSTGGSFMPIQDDVVRAQQSVPKFTADNLRSDFLPVLKKEQTESQGSQVAPPLDQPIREVLTASEIPTHTPDEANAFAPDRQANAVQLAGFSEAVYKKTKFTPATAKELILRYSLEQYENPLPGKPVNLVDFFRQPLTLERRSNLVQQYWTTYSDWANYVASEKYSQWLKQVPVPPSSSEQALLTAVEAVVANEVMAAEIKLVKSQAALAQYWPVLSQDSVSPIPNDLPLIQRYNTNYELYFSRQLVPSKFRGIDLVLPKMLALIERRAEAVGYAKSAADRILDPTEETHLLTALEAGKVLYAAERDLITSVVSYNRTIGDYALSVATQPKSAVEVVEMLIAKVPVTSRPQNGLSSKSTLPTVIPADVAATSVIPAKTPPVASNLSNAPTSVIGSVDSPTVSIARAPDFNAGSAVGDAQAGTTSVLQEKQEARIQDILSPPESDLISNRRPPSGSGIAAQPAPLPKAVESGPGFSLSPASKPPVMNSPDSKAASVTSGFNPPAGFKMTPPAQVKQFSKPLSENFRSDAPPETKPFRPSGFQPIRENGAEESGNEASKTGGFKMPAFSAPNFNPADQK